MSCSQYISQLPLEERTSLLTAVFSTMDDVLTAYIGPDHTYRCVNESFARAFGRTQEEMIGGPCCEVMPENLTEALANVERSRCVVKGQSSILAIKGWDQRFWDWKVAPVCGAASTFDGWFLWLRDVTVRENIRRDRNRLFTEVQTALALSTAEQERNTWRALFNAVPDAIAVFDSSGTVLEENHASAQLMSFSSKSITLTDYSAAPALYSLQGNAIEDERRPIGRILAGESLQDFPCYYINSPRGGRLDMLISGGKLPGDGLTERYYFILHDVTEMRRLEHDEAEARRLAEQRAADWEAVFNTIGDQITIFDARGKMLDANRAHLNMLGVDSVRELSSTQMPLHVKFFYPDGRPVPTRERAFSRVMRGETVVNQECYVESPRFGKMHLLISGGEVRTAPGRPRRYFRINHDITELQNLREALELSLEAAQSERDRLHVLLDSMTDEVWFTDTELLATPANLPARTRLGLNSTEHATRPLAEVQALTDVRNDDGSLRPMELSSTYLALKGQTVTNRSTVVKHIRTGDKIYQQVSAAPTRGLDGQITGAVSVHRDVTEQRLLQEQLKRAQEEKDRARTRFLSVMAHEVRNPMASILGSLELMNLRLAAGKGLSDLIATAKKETIRAVGLLSEVLDAFRAQEDQLPTRLVPIDLVHVLMDAVALFRATEDGSRLEVDIDTVEICVNGDARRLSDVFRNLIHNALKYSTALVTLRTIMAPERDAVVVEVIDSGIGIPAPDREHIFEPFYRAGNATMDQNGSGGVGLGLYLSKSIIDKHCGQIWVDSEPGKGSTFYIKLPLAKDLLGSSR